MALKSKKRKWKVVAAILAGGSGSRMKKYKTLKQFLPLGGQTIIQKTISVFIDSGLIDKVILTLPKDQIPVYQKRIKQYGFGDFVELIPGGKTRQESSFKAVDFVLKHGSCDLVLIHDAVRPFLSKKILKTSIHLAKKYGASEVAVPATDSLIESDGKFVNHILERKKHYCAQTPQTFHFDLILKAHLKAVSEKFNQATDDASLILRLGKKVALVEGSYDNIKITTPKDYELAEIISKNFKS